VTEEFRIVRGVINTGSSALAAFDYLVAHALAADFVLVPRTSAVRSIELQWPDRQLNPFSAQTHTAHVNFYLRQPILGAHRGLFAAAVERFGPVKPNDRREYRTHLHTVSDVDGMLAFLRSHGAWPSKRTDRRFVAATFEPVTAQHFLNAARRLAEGYREHAFGPSTDYDLLFNGKRLPPKAVFGLAASEALGFPVRPENFSAGESMTCFRMLRAAGYEIVPKNQPAETDAGLLSQEDRVWSEGRPRLISHLRRERSTGLASAKRDHFRALHGRLFCERCGMDPVSVFGSEVGEACIEVHHHGTHVAEMTADHLTTLQDLKCLCANCHRVTHRELRLQDA
jgi:hypothetical protein